MKAGLRTRPLTSVADDNVRPEPGHRRYSHDVLHRRLAAEAMCSAGSRSVTIISESVDDKLHQGANVDRGSKVRLLRVPRET